LSERRRPFRDAGPSVEAQFQRQGVGNIERRALERLAQMLAGRLPTTAGIAMARKP
jgi:hypothetical protein